MAEAPKKHLKASIIVVVLIIMMVSSFLVLVTMRYFVHMLSGFSTLTNYYKAYYMARGSMDVLLTQQSHRGWGYQVKDKNFSGALQCLNCDLTGNIIARFPRIDTSIQPTDGTCNANSAIVVSGGQSVIFPLFADAYSGLFTFQKDEKSFTELAGLAGVIMKVYSNDGAPSGKIYLYDANDGPFGMIKEGPHSLNSELRETAGTYGEMQEYYRPNDLFKINTILPNYFLIVSNPQNENQTIAPFRVCFTMPDGSTEDVPMIGLNTILRADARVVDSYVTLETIKTNRFPSFLVQ